jgi:hypothetical protein
MTQSWVGLDGFALLQGGGEPVVGETVDHQKVELVGVAGVTALGQNEDRLGEEDPPITAVLAGASSGRQSYLWRPSPRDAAHLSKSGRGN